MQVESEAQKIALDALEAERGLKFRRDLAKAMMLSYGAQVVLTFLIWLWRPLYTQLLLAGILITPVPLILMLILLPFFETKRHFFIGTVLFLAYIFFLSFAVPIICLPELSQPVSIAYAIIFIAAGLISGVRRPFMLATIASFSYLINLFVGHGIASFWFTPLDDTLVSILLVGLGIPAIYGSTAIFYFALIGQEQLYRQAQFANMESTHAKALAEDANRAKSAFLANMSHELRTPLNAILGFSQIMARDVALDSTHRESIEIINRSGEHLLDLINNVLDMAKIEAGRTTLQERGFDLYKLLESISAMFRLRANSKGLSLTVECAPDVPSYVQMDDGKLRQVLINLLGNAVKFTSAGGIVLRVHRGQAENQLHFEVEDTGVGISAEELTLLFEPFSQTSSGRQTGEGTGLGLPISRQFVRLMGGELTLSSQPGLGSCFSFDVIARPSDTHETDPNKKTKPRAIGLEPGQPNYRLLIVEDQTDSRLLLVELLSSVGFQVQTAGNGQEAIKIWENWQPHLIWMDMRMPIMNGREATKAIKALPGGQETVIIALTASSFIEEREQILADGCNDFIRKPYREEEIFDALTRHLNVRFLHENEMQQQGQHPPLNLTGFPADWLSKLHKAVLEADAEQIQALAQEISPTHNETATELIRLSNHFAYEAILAALDAVSPHHQK